MIPCCHSSHEHEYRHVTLPCDRTFCGDHDGVECDHCGHISDAVCDPEEYKEILAAFDVAGREGDDS